MPGRPSDRLRLLRRHRRLGAALLLALAAALAVRSALPAPVGTAVVTAGRDLPAGHVVAAADLATVLVPRAAAPTGALDEKALVGARLASPVREGEPVTDARVSGAGLTATMPPGQVAVPVLLGAQVRPWLAVGQRLQLVAAAGPGTVPSADPWAATAPGPARGLAVATVVDVADEADGGLLEAGGTGTVAVLVQVAAADAEPLAAAAGPVAAVLLGDR